MSRAAAGAGAWRIVAAKELRDAVRDRRSLLSALLYPLFGPVLIVAMLGYIIGLETREPEVDLPVVGADNAPGLIAHLHAQGIRTSAPPPDPEAAIKAGDLDAVLLIPEDFGADFRAAKPAAVELLIDRSQRDARAAVRTIEREIEGYSARVGGLRLLARGIDPSVAAPVALRRVDLATPAQRAGDLLSTIPMFILLAAFIGGMYVATDATAGERERGSLESLLITPAPRGQLVLGKFIATFAFAAATVVLTLAASLIALAQLDTRALGLTLAIGAGQVGVVLALVLPLAAVAAALQLWVATFARSFKEAQTYLSLMMFVPMVPGLVLTVAPAATAAWMVWVPVLGQQALVVDVLRGNEVGVAAIAACGLQAAVLTVVGLVAATALLRREGITAA
jgi:sodium transport system permease protein